MNLKEAFRYQNKLQALMSEAQNLLSRDANVTKVQNTFLHKKVMAEAEDETVVDIPENEYYEQITDIVGFLMYLLDQHEALAAGIRAAKNELPIDMDSEVGLNSRRQRIALTLRYMSILRSSEVTVPNGGVGYRFNTDGNQVPYKCDVRRVTTINFDRNVVRKHLANIDRKADAVSAELDRCMVNAEVDFVPPFNVNDSFADAFTAYLEGRE